MPNICICGIDPGASGALAFLFSDHQSTVSVEDMPLVNKKVCPAQLAEMLRVMKPDVVYVEEVHAMPKQGVTSMFNFGVTFGVTKGVIQALGIRVEFVTPKQWKKHFALNSDKEKSRELALRLWPARAELFKRKKDENRAEAALIALYGLRRMESQVSKGAA